MSTSNQNIARERQLDWLLDEVHGNGQARATHIDAANSATATATRWLTAALVVLAIGTAIGVSLLNNQETVAPLLAPNEDQAPATKPPLQWHECHDPAELAEVPADVVNLECFNFDDDDIAQLAKLERLERIKLGGMDVNEKGYSVGSPITDAGVAHLAGLAKLRFLSLRQCGLATGSTLEKLRAIPQLEHLNLSSTAITSEAIATLPMLPSLRELSLTYCMNFHGRSLEDIAKIPGLRRLELSYCPTISAKDAMHLTKLKELRHLDLSICCGAFLGQTEMMLDDVTGDEPPPPPQQNGIGITDEVVVALAAMQLETLKLGGCFALTDRIANSLATMTSLRSLDLHDLRKVTGAVLDNLPLQLRILHVHDNHQFSAKSLLALTRLNNLTELNLSGIPALDDEGLKTVLAGKRLTSLAIGGMREGMGRPTDKLRIPSLTPACRTTLSAQLDLEVLDLTLTQWLDTATMRELAAMPRLKEVVLQMSKVQAEHLAALAKSSSLRSVSLQSCRHLQTDAAEALRPAKLTMANFYGTRFPDDDVREIAKSWSGCTVLLKSGRMHRVQ
tara:strand:- start:27667 stop:29352 length:1686 start_codon:yes stop_codon:yes gene_type:complete